MKPWIRQKWKDASRWFALIWAYTLLFVLVATAATLVLTWISVVLTVVVLAVLPIGGYLLYQHRRQAAVTRRPAAP